MKARRARAVPGGGPWGRGRLVWPWVETSVEACRKARGLTHRAFHFEADQAVELERVLHREFLREHLDEAEHDQVHPLVLLEPARHEVEEHLVVDLADRGLEAD